MHRNKYDAKIWYKHHKLKRLSDEASGYPAPAYYKHLRNSSGKWVERDKPYYRRLYRGKRSTYLKRLAAKRTRRNINEVSSKGQLYKKQFDFWWELD